MAKELPLRDALPESMTWNLQTIFASDEAWKMPLKNWPIG